MTDTPTQPSAAPTVTLGAQPPAPATPAPATPTPAPTNPMLSHVSNPPPVTPTVEDKPVPVEPPIIKLPEASAPTVSTGTTSELAGVFSTDPQVKLATDYVDAILKDTGVDWERAFGKVKDELDPRFIDREYLKEKLGDKADGVIQTTESLVAFLNHQKDQIVNSVFELAGSEDQWFACLDAYKKSVDKVELQTLTGLLESGDLEKVKWAASKIVAVGRGSGNVVTHSPAALGGNSAERGLSAADYRKEISKPGLTNERYTELRNLRALGKRQNLN